MENFNINRFFKVLINSKLYIAFIILLSIVIGYFYSFYYVTPMYNSSATVMLVQNDGSDVLTNNDSITGSDITLNQNLLSTYTKIAKSDRVLEQVISNLNLDMSIQELYKNVSIQSINNTEVFKVSVNNQDASVASKVANELVTVFSKEVQTLYNMNNVYIMDEAIASETPFNINHVKDIIMFAGMGVVASFGLVVLIYLLDTTIKSEEDIEEYAGLSVLSTIPVFQNKNNKTFNELIVSEQPKSPISECFKTFRTNVMFSIQNKALNTILITSGFMGEGKSFVSSNLAVTFAQSGKKIILIDTDMRKGRLHKIFKLSNDIGLSNCLAKIASDGSSVNINEFIQKNGVPNLHVMTSGTVPPNPSELLSSPSMKMFLEALNTQYDVVICDGTPCMLVSDSIILSKIVDTTVIVTANKVTKLDTLLKIKKSIDIVGGNIGGAIINKMPVSQKAYQNKYYYGNHNETNFNMNFTTDVTDALLDNKLFINECFTASDVPQNDVENIADTFSNDGIMELSNMISNNYKEISDLKALYKNTMNNTLDAISKNNVSDTIMNEFNDLKASYENNMNCQNSKIEDLSKKISSISDANIMLELDDIKNTYMTNIKLQNDELAKLSDKILGFDFDNYSESIFAELQSTKEFYENTIKVQNATISSLEDKIYNLDFNDNSNVILDELNSIKADYNAAIDSQNNYIASLEDKISNLDLNDNSDVILDELNSIKADYNAAINSQNNYIASLEDKISNLDFNDNSDVILDELNSIKADYSAAIDSQNNYIASLEDKISSLDFNDNSDVILDELNSIKANYQNAIELQNIKIDSLDNKLSNVKIPDNSELSNEVASIYKQLEIINSRFDYLEQQALHNEELIKSFVENNTTTVNKNRVIDTKQLDEKVISIQDYLENEYNTVINLSNSKKSNRKNKNVLEGQMNIIDNLLDNTKTVDNSNKDRFVVDYDSVRNKQKRNLFSFNKPKYVEPDYEEEINIVSQILA